MAPECSKQKQIVKQSFGNPSKFMGALDFEDDEPAPKNSKASFSLGKMVDELDLDDTLKTNKEPETPVYSKKGKRDLSSPSTASKYCKKGLFDSLSGACESNSTALAGTTVMKVAPPTPAHVDVSEKCDDRIKRGVEVPSEPNLESSERFSNEMEVKVLSSETKEKATLAIVMESTSKLILAKQVSYDAYESNSTVLAGTSVMKVAPPTPAHVDVSEECGCLAVWQRKIGVLWMY